MLAVRKLCLLVAIGMFVSSRVLAVPLASTKEDRWAKEHAIPPEGKALVYLYRSDTHDGQPAVTVRLDRGLLGQLDHGSFVLVVVDPGRHEVITGDRQALLSFVAESGRIYFIRLFGRREAGKLALGLQQVPYATGRQEVYHSRLVKNGYLSVAGALRPVPKSAPIAQRTKPPREAKTPPLAKPPPARRERFALMLKGGSLGPVDRLQTIAGLALAFDDKSSVFDGELQWRMSSGLAFGVELLSISTGYQAEGLSGEADTVVVLGGVKKYFRPASIMRPYVGAGLGSVGIDFSGPIIGNSFGLALHAVGGVEFLWERVGLCIEAGYLSADTEDDAGQKADMSGRGIFAGLTLQF